MLIRYEDHSAEEIKIIDDEAHRRLRAAGEIATHAAVDDARRGVCKDIEWLGKQGIAAEYGQSVPSASR